MVRFFGQLPHECGRRRGVSLCLLSSGLGGAIATMFDSEAVLFRRQNV